MKKIFLFSICFIAYLFVLPSVGSANDLTDIKTTQELHKELKEASLLEKDEKGFLVLTENINSLGINQELLTEYSEMLELTNQQIEDGIISFDAQLNVEPFTVEEISDKVFENDKIEDEPTFSTMATYLNAINIVEKNRTELKKIYNVQRTVNPSSAWSFSVGWWVGKVKVKGAWDYKSVSGYSPWYKNFSMQMYTGVETHNSKFLGNYNYGYTGQFLFPLTVLNAGGDAVSIALNWKPDSQAVKNTIKRGYNDSVRHK